MRASRRATQRARRKASPLRAAPCFNSDTGRVNAGAAKVI